MEAVICAGGRGTRLGSIAKEIPKALVPIAGKPILQRQLEDLARSGIARVTILTGHLGELIDDFVHSRAWDLEIVLIREERPLGTGGGLAQLKGMLDEPFIFLYGDLILSMDFGALIHAHREGKRLMTLVAHPNSHPYDSDLILEDEDGLAVGLLAKNAQRAGYYGNLVNAGVYVLDPRLLEGIENGRKIDFEKEILGKYIALREARCHRTTEYIKDMGTPERLSQAERDIESGIVEGRRRSNKQRAIFLDRDGTINKYVGLLYKPEMFELLSGAAAAIRRINRSPYLCFVVSNQPVVARNLCDMATVGNIHRKMETELGKEHAFLDDIVFCPHHPDRGFPGENAEYKVQCDCRKPKPGMLLDIAKRYNVELKSSFLIGDTTGDIQTAKNAGVKSILVETGEGGRDGKYEARPDHAAPDLGHAVEWILNREGINA